MDIRDSQGFRPDTEHGLLLVYGEFARRLGLVDSLLTVPVPARFREIKPQTKIVEFAVGILAGIEYLQDLDKAAHPLTKDRAVANAWGQPRFAHYSGVSRALDAAGDATVAAVQKALADFSKPFIDEAISAELLRGTTIVYDVDLTGQPVSSTSRTYPGAAFGWMDDAIRLGYQLARVSVETQRYGRLWLGGIHHSGSTVSVSCLQDLIEAAEQTTGIRPRRRTELVRATITDLEKALAHCQGLAARQEALVSDLQARLEQLTLQLALAAGRLGLAEAPTLPKSLRSEEVAPLKAGTWAYQRLTEQRVGWVKRRERTCEQLARAQVVLAGHNERARTLAAQLGERARWLARLEADNTANPDAPVCAARADAGFGSGRNAAWLIEMGYDLYGKALGDQTTRALRKQVTPETRWVAVGANAELALCGEYHLRECPYPLIAGLERFHTGATVKHASLLMYSDHGPGSLVAEASTAGTSPTDDATAAKGWFDFYNGRQTIEAGNKESKTVFHVQHLLTRSRAGIALQVAFTTFASNFVRWVMDSLRSQVSTDRRGRLALFGSVKGLTRVAANAPAYINQNGDSRWLEFANNSGLPEVVIHLGGSFVRQLTLDIGRPLKISSP